jgi:hypothetical protein
MIVDSELTTEERAKINAVAKCGQCRALLPKDSDGSQCGETVAMQDERGETHVFCGNKCFFSYCRDSGCNPVKVTTWPGYA